MTQHINPNLVHSATIYTADIEALLGPVGDDSDLGPLDRPLAVTTFKTRAAGRKTERRMNLREIAAMIPEQRATEKDKLPLLKLATFGDARTPRGSLRSNANMVAVGGVEGDYDGGPITLGDAGDRLQAAGIAGLVYDSPSAEPGVNKWRVLCPLSGEVSREARRAHAAILHCLFDGALDIGATFTPSQAFYFGGVGQKPRVLLSDGGYLDRAAGIEPLFPNGDKGDRTGETAGPKLALSPDAFAAAVRAVENDHRFDARDDWLRFGAAIYHQTDGGEDGRALWHEFSERHGSYDADKADAAWESLDPPRSTGATVLRFARQDGWTDPADDVLDRFDVLEEPAAAEKDKDRAKHGNHGLIFLTPDQCVTTPARDYVVKGMIAPGDVGCIFGEPGAGKSLIAPLIGYRVAQGERAFGLRARQGGVLYVAAEDPSGMKGRIRALRQALGDAPDFLLVPGVAGLFDFAAGKESSTLNGLRAEVAKRKPRLVIIDTLAMAFPGLDENDAKAMSAVVMVGRKLAEHGAAVVFVHHTPKAGDTPRGHSVFNGALDFALLLEKGDAKGIVRGRLTKNRNGPQDLDIAFRIGVADFGEDDDGDRLTAAHAVELAGGDDVRRAKLTKTEDAALSALVQLSEEAADGWVSGAAWREAMANDAKVSASDKPDSRRKAVVRSIEGLTRKDVVEQRGEDFRPASVGPDYTDAFSVELSDDPD